MAGFQPPPRKKIALDNRKLNLSAPTPGHQGKFASLIWGLHKNNPRITVYTNDPTDTGPDANYGKIVAALDGPVFFAFLHQLNQVVDGPNDVKLKVENKNFSFAGGKRSDRPVVMSELWFGKNPEGIVWLSVAAPNRPKIQFKFTLSDFHQFIKADGTPFNAAEGSVAAAKGYIKVLEQMMAIMMADNFEEPPPKDGGQGGGGGYGNRGGGGGQGGGGGGYNRGGQGGGGGGAPRSGGDDIAGDDLPF